METTSVQSSGQAIREIVDVIAAEIGKAGMTITYHPFSEGGHLLGNTITGFDPRLHKRILQYVVRNTEVRGPSPDEDGGKTKRDIAIGNIAELLAINGFIYNPQKVGYYRI